MSALGYSIAGVLVGLGVAAASAIVAGIWFAVSGMRPELLERTRPDER